MEETDYGEPVRVPKPTPFGFWREALTNFRTEGERRERKPTQVEIGNHLDLSDRSVREILLKLGIDHRESNLSTIRIAYIRYLRETAAGRGGDEQVNLTLQRTRQAEADANLKQLELFARAERLVSIDELEPKLAHWASMARSEVENGTARLIVAIENQHGIEVGRKLVDR